MHDKTSVILLLPVLNTDSIEHHGRDCMVVGFTIYCAISAYYH